MRNTNKKGGKLKSIATLLKVTGLSVAIGFLVWAIYTGNTNKLPSTSPVETAIYTQEIEAQEDPRIAEYLASEEAKLVARESIYEKDRRNENASSTEILKQLEIDYKEAVRLEEKRHAQALTKINANIDAVRKDKLNLASSTSVKGN